MPFLAPVFAFIGTTLAAGGIGAFALRLGASLLLSAASSALARKDTAQATMQGRTVSVREPVGSRRIIYGRARAGGTIVYMNTRTNGDITESALDLVIVLAGHGVKSIGAMYFDGEMAMDAAGAVQGRFVGTLDVQKKATAGGNLTLLQSRAPDLWTVAHRLQGCAAVYVQLIYNQDVYPTGIPNISFDIEGRDTIFDPRTGSYGYSENAALCLADYMADPVFGLGAAIGGADGIATAALIAAANVCDETVAAVGGGSELRYICNGIVDTAVEPKANIESLLTAMAGTCGWQAGQWQIYAGAYRTPLLSLTSDDIVEAGLSVTTRISRAENFNCVRGTFVAPENDWQQDDFPAYQSATYIAEDGGETIWRDIVLPFTISASMAQRLAKIEVERNRRQLTVFLDGKLKCWQAAIGDTVSLSYARWGWSGKPFEVSKVNLGVSASDSGAVLTAQLALRETSPLVYEWNVSEAQVYAAAPRTALPTAFSISAPGTPTATESLYQTLNGAGVKAKVTLTWPASASAFATLYQVEMLAGGVWINQGRTDALTAEVLDIAPGIYQFRVKALTGLGVSSDWATTAPIELSGLRAPPVAITGLTLQTAGGLAILKWDLHADLDVRAGGFIYIRHSAASSPGWANSVSMDVVSGSQAIAVVALKPGAYVLRAEDSSGNLGPVVTASTDGAQAVAFAPVTTLVEDTTFTGTKTDCFVSAGALQISTTSLLDSWPSVDAIANIDAEGGIAASASYNFAAGMNFGSIKRTRLRSIIDISVLNILSDIDTRTGDIDTWLSFDGADGSEVDVYVEARTTQTSPSGSPVWSGWSRVDSHEVQAWGVQARAILNSYDPSFTPIVSTLRLAADEVV